MLEVALGSMAEMGVFEKCLLPGLCFDGMRLLVGTG